MLNCEYNHCSFRSISIYHINLKKLLKDVKKSNFFMIYVNVWLHLSLYIARVVASKTI